jgi:hypothetical protein
MNESPGHKIYSAADIERYHKGMMTAQERHALEKAALDDPFLADAIEGYTFTETPQADIHAIQQRIYKEKRETKTIPFIWRYNWIKIAALFIIMAGGGWLIFRSVGNRQEISLATTPATEKEITLSPSAPVADSIVVQKTEPLEETKIEAPDKPAVFRAKANKFKTPTPIKPKNVNTAIATNKKNIREQPTGVTLEEAPVSTMASPKKDNAAENNPARSRSFKTPENNKEYAAAAQAKTAVLPNTDTLRNLDVVLRPDTQTNDIEIVQLKSKHKVLAMPSPRFETLEPAEGWAQFNDYIAENIKEPQTYKEKPDTGDVELAFDINQDGEPVNITVARSFCTDCNKKAIQLLKQGPRWKNTKDKKGKITFHF